VAQKPLNLCVCTHVIVSVSNMPLSFIFKDESLTYEWNQRLMVLYGAGRQKTEVKRAVRKVTRHLVKLVQNKRDIDGKQG